MDRQFLVLHGLGNRRPRAHWQSWLVEQLRRRGEQVRYPQLPDPDRPALASWLDALASEYGQMGDGERIVVCHSLACALWYQASSRGVIDPPADRLVLVAPPGPSGLAEPASVSFNPAAWDGATLRASCRGSIRLVASDADPYCQEGPAALVYGSLLGIASETIPSAGHLTPADGYGPWPAMLDWCLGASACVDLGASGPDSA
jgi:predicted alpha/beta hydrolase family esterase